MPKILKYINLSVRRVLLVLVEGYSVAISPLLPSNCRFYPTCSTYTGNAIRLHGWRHGTFLAAKRILRCHPLHPGGVDPVPSPSTESRAAGEEV